MTSSGLSAATEAADRILSSEPCQRLSDADRSQLRQAVDRAHISWHSAHVSDPPFVWVFLFWPAVFVVVQWLVNQTYFELGFSWKTIVDPVLALIAGLLITGVGAYIGETWSELVVIKKIWTRFKKARAALLRRKAKKFAKVLCLLGASALLLVVAATVSDEGLVGVFVSLVIDIVSSFGVIVGISSLQKWGKQVANRKFLSPDPHDELIYDLSLFLEEAAKNDAEPWGSWRTNRYMRSDFAHRIESAARRVQERLPLIVRRAQPVVRASLRDLSARIATTLTSLAYDVAIGGQERDEELAERLTSMLVAAAYGRWEKLAADKKVPAARRLLRRYGRKVSAAIVLIASGLIIPAFFGSVFGSIAPQLRIALLAAGVLSLIDTPKSAMDRIAEVFKGR